MDARGLASALPNRQYALVASDAPAYAWKPDGWGEWSQTRRTLWRREEQAKRMAALQLEPAKAADRDRLVEHLRAEAAALRRQLLDEEDEEPSA